LKARIHRVTGGGTPLAYVPGIDGSGELLLGTEGRLGTAGFRLCLLRYEDEDAPLGEDPYRDLADSVRSCLEEVFGEEHALLLAESFGVGVALRTVLEHPSAVSGLCLVNGFCRFDKRLRLALSRLGALLVPKFLFRPLRNLCAPWSLFGASPLPFLRTGKGPDPRTLDAFRKIPGTPFDRGYRKRLAMIRGLDLRARLPEIRVPVHIFASDRDRIVDSPRSGRIMAKALPRAVMTILQDRGHLVLPLENEDWPRRLRRLADESLCSGPPPDPRTSR